MNISTDLRINKLHNQILAALMDNDIPKFVSSCEAAAQLAKAYLVNVEDTPFEITDPIKMIPFPDAMGLHGVSFAKDEPMLVSAFPGNGKSLFCYNLAAHMLKDKYRVCVIHNERDQQDYAVGIYRILWSLLPPPSARRLSIDDVFAEKGKVEEWLKKMPLQIINAKKDGPKEIIARMTRIMAKQASDIILFDWLQNVNIPDDNLRFKGWSWIAQQLEDICSRYKVPVCVFGQMNREGGRERMAVGAPGLGVLEGCPQMEQKAGIVLNMKRGPTKNDDYHGVPHFWINIAKNRRGMAGQRSARVDFESGAFTGSLDPDQVDAVIAHVKAQRKRTA